MEFKKEVSFLSKVLNDQQVFVEEIITKTATFKELSRTDKDQHKLHFMLVSIYKSNGDEEIKLDSDQVYDITVKFIKSCLICDKTENSIATAAQFTEQDKIEFLNDGGALINFGLWLLNEKIAPFFTQLIKK